jgi:hypothetical protein
MRIAAAAALMFFLLCSVTSAQVPEIRTEYHPKEGGVVRCVEGPPLPSTRVEGIGTYISCSWVR